MRRQRKSLTCSLSTTLCPTNFILVLKHRRRSHMDSNSFLLTECPWVAPTHGAQRKLKMPSTPPAMPHMVILMSRLSLMPSLFCGLWRVVGCVTLMCYGGFKCLLWWLSFSSCIVGTANLHGAYRAWLILWTAVGQGWFLFQIKYQFKSNSMCLLAWGHGVPFYWLA